MLWLHGIICKSEARPPQVRTRNTEDGMAKRAVTEDNTDIVYRMASNDAIVNHVDANDAVTNNVVANECSVNDSPANDATDLPSIVFLLDFYGELLTPRQSEVLNLHYNDDLSLAEIAEDLQVSRQAVHDAVRTGKALLNRYESKLGLVARFLGQQDMVREALVLVHQALEAETQMTQKDLTRRAGDKLLQLLEQL